MSPDESTGSKQKTPTTPEAAEGDTSPSAPVDFQIIDLEPIGKALERSRQAAQGPALRRPPTARVGKIDDKSVQYDLAGDAIEIPSVFSTQNVTRSVRSGQPLATGPSSSVSSSSPRASSNGAAQAAPSNKKVLLLSLAVALLAVTNAITAYKLYSRSGQAPAGASARTNDISDDSAESGSAVRAGVSHPKPASGGLGAAGSHEAAEPEPELPPAATLPVAEAQEWDAARFSKAQVVEARCSFNGKLYTFRTPGCTSFVKLPAEALPASMAQAPGETPDVFQITHATGEGEPLMDCKMQGGTSIQVRTGKKPGLEEDLLRHTATALAVAKRGDVEILYVCALPDNACRSLLTSLSAIPGALMIVPAVNAGSRNPMVMIPHSNPGSLRVKFRKSPKEAWSSTDPSSDLEIPSVGKVTFKFTSGPAGKWLAVSTEPDEEFSGLAKKCGPHPLPAAGDKTASPEQQHMLQLLGIAQGYSVRIEDAVGRKLAAFRLSLAIPRNNLPQD